MYFWYNIVLQIILTVVSSVQAATFTMSCSTRPPRPRQRKCLGYGVDKLWLHSWTRIVRRHLTKPRINYTSYTVNSEWYLSYICCQYNLSSTFWCWFKNLCLKLGRLVSIDWSSAIFLPKPPVLRFKISSNVSIIVIVGVFRIQFRQQWWLPSVFQQLVATPPSIDTCQNSLAIAMPGH